MAVKTRVTVTPDKINTYIDAEVNVLETAVEVDQQIAVLNIAFTDLSDAVTSYTNAAKAAGVIEADAERIATDIDLIATGTLLRVAPDFAANFQLQDTIKANRVDRAVNLIEQRLSGEIALNDLQEAADAMIDCAMAFDKQINRVNTAYRRLGEAVGKFSTAAKAADVRDDKADQIADDMPLIMRGCILKLAPDFALGGINLEETTRNKQNRAEYLIQARLDKFRPASCTSQKA